MAIDSRPLASTNPPDALSRIYAWFSSLAQGDLATLTKLVQQHVPVEVPHPLRHTTALMEATRRNHMATVAWLLEQGANPLHGCGIPLGTPLHTALRLNLQPLTARLLEVVDQITTVDAYGHTPLHALCMEPRTSDTLAEAVPLGTLLIDKKCPLDALDHEGITALHYSVINDCPALAELLLRHGANPNALIPNSWVSPLTIAALEKNRPMAELLLRFGADATLPTREGSTPNSIWGEIDKIKITE